RQVHQFLNEHPGWMCNTTRLATTTPGSRWSSRSSRIIGRGWSHGARIVRVSLTRIFLLSATSCFWLNAAYTICASPGFVRMNLGPSGTSLEYPPSLDSENHGRIAIE